MKYDYLIVGAGLFGAVFAREAVRRGKTCLVLDRRDHIGGNIYTKEVEEFEEVWLAWIRAGAPRDAKGRPVVPESKQKEVTAA